MPLRVAQAASLASGACNEDRWGAVGDLAWVLDGCTDVVETPLTGEASDAAWLAGTLHNELIRIAAEIPTGLSTLPGRLAKAAAAAFAKVRHRPPRDRCEHPSATGVIVRAAGSSLDFVAIGDCTLIAEGVGGTVTVGLAPDDAGDRWLARAIAAFHEREHDASAEAARAHVWPRIRAGRAFMNQPDGYGVFSITPTPERFVRSGAVAMRPGGHALLVSDGLMRLVDVFRCYDAAGLLAAAIRSGLDGLLAELRHIEHSDSACRRYPRAKPSDDATGLLLRLN